MNRFLIFLFALSLNLSWAQEAPKWQGTFEQLGQTLPTPNEYRTASGAPGPKYWQQRCDYDIKASLDEKALKLTGQLTKKVLKTRNPFGQKLLKISNGEKSGTKY